MIQVATQGFLSNGSDTRGCHHFRSGSVALTCIVRCCIVRCCIVWFLSVFIPCSPILAGSPSLMVADSSRDHLVHLRDLDGDDRYDGVDEAHIFYDDSADGPDLSVPTALLATPHRLLLLDGGTLDAVLSLQDLDGDGFAGSADEVTILYDDSAAGPDLAVPVSMTLDQQGRILIADRSTTRRHVLLLEDLDGDGQMASPGEGTIWLQRDGNPLLPDTFLPTAVLHRGDGEMLVADGGSAIIYRCLDLDGDGTIVGADELQIWFSSPAATAINTIDTMVRCPDGSVLIADEEQGLVLRAQDLDGSGQIEPWEVVPFVDGQAPLATVETPRRLLPIPGGTVIIGDADQDALFRVQDLDGDGEANSIDEQQPAYLDGGQLLPSVAGISLVPGPLVITIDQVSPQLVDETGGTTLLIEGNGWNPGAFVTLRIGGEGIEATAPLNTLITAILPPLASGQHDLVVEIDGQDEFVATPIVAVPFFIRGDVDGDQSVNITDAIFLLRWLYLPASDPVPCPDSADLDDNGLIQLQDAIALLNFLFLYGDPPQPPHPLEGADPDQTGPGCQP